MSGVAVVAAQGARVHTTCRLISKPKVRSATRCQQQLSSHRVQLNSTQPFGKHISSIRLTRHQPKRSHPQASLQEAVAVLTETPVRDVAAVIASIVGARLLIVVCELLEEQNVIDQILSRKLVHTLAGPGLLAMWPLFSAAPYARFIAAIVPLLNGIRLLLIGNSFIKDEKAVRAISRTGDPTELLRGPMYYVIVLLIVSLLYWRDSPVGLVVCSLMCGGDGLADIIGRRFGKVNKLPWNSNKSWAGSLAMLFGGFSMSMGLITLYSHLGYIQVDMPITTLAVASISFIAAIIESLPINQTLDDNLSVPGVAAFLGVMLLQVGLEIL